MPYAVIGGLAVAARGAVRATKDVDLLVDWPLQQAKSLADALINEGLPATLRQGSADDPIPAVIRLAFPTPETTVACDILFPSKAWQSAAVRAATAADLGGFVVPVVQANDLFLLKLYAGGPMDLFDAAHLFELQNGEDRQRWKERAAKISRSKALARCLKFLSTSG